MRAKPGAVRAKLPPTRNGSSLREELGATEFLGYDTEKAEGNIVAIVKDGARVNSAKAGETALILTNQTPFYGESGGQVGDQGAMSAQRRARPP